MKKVSILGITLLSVIALSACGHSKAHSTATSTPSTKSSATITSSSKDTKKAESEALKSTAESAVKYLEDNQIRENIQPAQEAVDKLTDESAKSTLQTRIDAVTTAITKREEEAQRQAEIVAQQEAQRQAELAQQATQVQVANQPQQTYSDIPQPPADYVPGVGGIPSDSPEIARQEAIDQARKQWRDDQIQWAIEQGYME